jgi:hypothetical protein
VFASQRRLGGRIVLPFVETRRRWNMLAECSAWLDDYCAAALLICAWRPADSASERQSKNC